MNFLQGERGKTACLLGLLFLLVLPLFAKDLRLGELNLNNDETRHAMTGVFFRDFLADLPLGDPLGYTLRYYGRYPAIGLLHWPPFFYFVEGVFFLAFGITVPVARILVILFSFLLIFYWFRLVKVLGGLRVAFFASLLLASVPAIVLYSRAVMLEIPSLSLSVATVYYFHSHFEEKRGGLLPMMLFFVAACLTKATVAFLVLFFFFYLLSRKKLKMLISRRMFTYGFLALAVLGPYYAFAWGQHGFMTLMDISKGTIGEQGWKFPGTLFYYIRYLPYQIGWPLLLLVLGSTFSLLSFGSIKKQSLPLLWILACYLTFTPVAQKDSRYIVYWIPPFALLAAQAAGVRRGGWVRAGGLAAVIGLSLLHFYRGLTFERPYVEGYRDAARFAVANSRSRILFFQGFLNGNFIFHVRQADPEKKHIVIRGGKVLVATNIVKEYALVERAHTEADIHEILQRYGVEYVIMEDKDVVELPIYGVLREMVKGLDFRKEARFPLKTNILLFEGMDLVAYRYLKARPLERGARLTLPMPALGRELDFAIEDL